MLGRLLGHADLRELILLKGITHTNVKGAETESAGEDHQKAGLWLMFAYKYFNLNLPRT